MGGPTLRVLLVDDHPMVRAGLRTDLAKHLRGVEIAEAGSATEALALLRARRFDLVILDVNLPGMNGVDLARRIRGAHQHLKLMMVAADTDPWSVNEAMRAGANAFLAKTNSGERLREAIRAVLAGEEFLCPESQAARQQPRQGRDSIEPPCPAILSSREREVLCHLAQGDNTKTTASRLGISPKTVETHRSHIMRKLGLHSVANLTRYAIRHRVVAA